MNYIWYFILERLKLSKAIILLCVVESQGSSPGRHGFKMAVADDDLFGSIGGGIMEHKFVEMAKEQLKNLNDESIIKKQLHNKTSKKNQSGMICSGEQTIVLFNLTPNDIPEITKIIESLENYRNGTLTITPGKLNFDENIHISDYYFEMKSEDDWIYKERTGFKNHLYIVGGGHCSLSFSKLMSGMDFYIHLYDDRNDINTFRQNKYAHEKILVKDYSELEKHIPSGSNNYVVIMTFGYRTDDIAFRALINKDFKYFGVLGSKSKITKMFEEWRNDKLPEEKLKSIFSPVGIQINSRTTEEIAISIAAEIIKVKNS